MKPCFTIFFLFILGASCEQPSGDIDEAPHNGVDAGISSLFDLPSSDAGPGAILESDSGTALDCDEDRDGYEGQQCNGDDCDDNNPLIHPQARERCSFIDENCNASNNEFLDCSFIAAGPYDLYRVDPFKPEIEWLSNVQPAGESGGMLDIDIDTEGQLVAVKKNGLYALDDNGDLVATGAFEDDNGVTVTLSTFTNGMAINSAGAIFLTNSEEDRSVTPYESAAAAHTVQAQTGVISVLGSLAPYVSSGDCVALKNDSILMTARLPGDQEGSDLLVFVDSDTAQTTLIGDTGYRRIFGLSASFGHLFGVTEDAKVLKINAESAESELLLDCGESETLGCPPAPAGEDRVRFWGAANGD
jgi:hypothetical protein